MALSITNHIVSLMAQQSFSKTSGSLAQSIERLSTGLKINRGADGPAALVISEQQRAQIASLNAALQATNRTVAIVQTGDSALGQISSLLTRVRGLIVDSANSGTNDAAMLQANQAEIDQAVGAVNQIGATTKFGDIQLFSGSTTLRAGAGGQELTLPEVNAVTLGMASDDSSTPTADQSFASITGSGANSVAGGNAAKALEIVDRAISQVAGLRGELGAFQANALESSADNLMTSLENTTAAESAIRDTDFAAEIANYTRLQIQMQVGALVLKNANQTSQLVASLLRG